ncbi:outer membrane porin GjpA [[Mycobacterium] kokjensenii]|uniref:Outer membrane porin GjpA n=1 Tax=[Mycobacterium] kokjensenii TaxID=3064287 RepID=A0ABM9LL14_9MYCO|nr:outer membrane porin GjpA [Mycolicibacter sp. MU0083]CAJ1500851.1 outer membrane porin GjpA [Mycolicibacter sp. MU0083]
MSRTIAAPWVAAGIALVGAGAIAATPATAPLAALSDLQSRAVQLTASWDDVLATAQANAADIQDHFSAAPFPALQQQLANQIGYIQGLLDGSLKFSDVTDDIQNHVNALFGTPATDDTPATPGALFGPFLPGVDSDILYPSLDSTVNSTGTGLFDVVFLNHQFLIQILFDDGGVPRIVEALGLDASALPLAEALINFASSPLSGILMGEIGTALSPVLQFSDDINVISEAMASGDTDAALQALTDMPANLVNAYLNGYGTVDLMPLLDELGIDLPPLEIVAGLPTDLTGLSLELGGLFSSGGGSIVDALGIVADGGEGIGVMDLPGLAVGPLAAMVEFGQSIAMALGWDGSGDILGDLF